MKFENRRLLFAFILSLCGGSMLAQSEPKVTDYTQSDKSYIVNMSDNGLFAVAQPAYSSDAKAPKLIDLTTGEVTNLLVTTTQSVHDVTNDGTLMVGQSDSKPAYCKIEGDSAVWITLPLKGVWAEGVAVAVTPDGKFAVGNLYASDGYTSIPALWNLETGKLVSTSNLPQLDMAHENKNQMTFNAISADGNLILGCMSYSYLPAGETDGGCCYFIYNVSKQSYKMIGFTEKTDDTWTPLVEGVTLLEAEKMSTNGKFVTGSVTIYDDGTEDSGVYPFLYEVDSDQLTVYNNSTDVQGTGYAVSNDGVVLLSTPNSTPVREWSVRKGNYWYSISQIYAQRYKKDFYDETSLDNSGTANAISDDGKRIVAFPDPYGSYVIDLDVPVGEICNSMTVLGSYTVSPAEGSAMSKLGSVTFTFPYAVTALGSKDCAKLLDEQGNTVASSIGLSCDGTVATVTFRKSKAVLEAGKQYRLYLPQGSVAVTSDQAQMNGEIYVTYQGRADEAVKVTNYYPAAGTTLTCIDNSTSPVILTFNTDVAVASDAHAYLYRNDETEPLCQLVIAYQDSRIALYPSTKQYLFKGNSYTVALSQGAVTDLGGNNPCDSVSVIYQGGYERTISPDDVNLFTSDFNSGINDFMLYCGDQNTPDTDMQEWGFYKGLPWWLVSDDDNTSDMSAVSHSCYDTEGQSDDWMVTPQIFIPDQLCSLDFKCQSYRKDKEDYLKIVVWATDKVYNELTTSIVDQMKKEGTIVYNEQMDPGDTEGQLAGEWEEVSLPLKEFAGKNVYIAFVNENKAQSAVFVDDVKVLHNMTYLVTFNNASSVVNQQNIIIKGQITGNNEEKSYQKMTLKLKDSQGNVLDTYSASDLNLGKNQNVSFQFSKSLPLTVGQETRFSVETLLDDESNEVTSTVKDLAFQPKRHVVIEEYTGTTCGNCPLGILAIEKAEKQYGDQVLPVSIHTYTGDTWATGMGDYTSFLGFSAAPSARINRADISYPAASATVSGQARYFFHASEAPDSIDDLWLDQIDDLMATPVEAQIECSASYDATAQQFTVPVKVRYALNSEDVNVNLFAVLLEDKLTFYQENYFSTAASSDLGEWGMGGSLGQEKAYPVVHNDVARQCVGVTYNGTSGLVPTTLVAGQTYTAELTVPVPSTVSEVENCKVVVMLIDAGTGKIINAASSAESGSDAITSVSVDNHGDAEGTYTLSGVRVSGRLTRGLYIQNGKKIIIK